MFMNTIQEIPPNELSIFKGNVKEWLDNDQQITLTEAVGASGVSTKTVLSRQRAKLQGADKNISIFKMPTEAIKTLKTTQNLGITDTNFTVRRQFTQTLSSTGECSISAGTNETFAGVSNRDFVVSIIQQAASVSGQLGDVQEQFGSIAENFSGFGGS